MLRVKLGGLRVVNKFLHIEETNFRRNDTPLHFHVMVELFKQFFSHNHNGMDALVKNEFLGKEIFKVGVLSVVSI